MEETTIEHKSNPAKTAAIVIIALIIIAAVGVGAYQATKKDTADTIQTTPTTAAMQAEPTTDTTGTATGEAKATTYKDGTYTATGNYISPGGDEELDVTLTLKGDLITESTVEPKATRPNSVKFQGLFADNYKPLVIGKNIDEVVLGKVSGSSLAPKGFNDAVEKIKTEAKS